MIKQKNQAIIHHDIVMADSLKSEITEAEASLKRKRNNENNDSREVDSRIEILKRQKQHAIEQEDFKKASEVRVKDVNAKGALEQKKRQ